MKHCDQVIELLRRQISNDQEVNEIKQTAEAVAKQWVDPLSGGREQKNGLVYGLVQSGKTGVLTVIGGIAGDTGYKTIIILTSDIDPLYQQTLSRVREAFPGMDILSKLDLKDHEAFIRRIRAGTCAIVVSKNTSHLRTLNENFQKGNLKGLSCLIIDDEADQASLNTRARNADGSRSAINEHISNLRTFFDKNTYLHVTATPAALFLQPTGHDFRPEFTELSHPGSEYVGGEDYFGSNSDRLIREFNLTDLAALVVGAQPNPGLEIPKSLLNALDTFMIAATFKRASDVSQNSAFLCHVSLRKSDHDHIVRLLRDYKMKLKDGLSNDDAALKARLKRAYNDLAQTDASIASTDFDWLLEKLEFFVASTNIKLVNGETDEDVAVNSPFNLFVGGNKLGRGVTIKNLLVSYYGRNPRKPQADTMLQHARMYGYRRKDLGLLRLFLPPELNKVFQSIHSMEQGLRELILNHPSEDFRGVYVEGNLEPTRKNILVPGAVGVYGGGGNYNPAQVLRTESVIEQTAFIDDKVAPILNNTYTEICSDEAVRILALVQEDMTLAEGVWDKAAICESIRQYSSMFNQNEVYVYVDRDRGLNKARRESQGILEGGEANSVPADKVTIFLLRTASSNSQNASWWPQVRFPRGRYAFAFAI